MKPPVPGEMLRRYFDGKLLHQALLVQHVDSPTKEWLDEDLKVYDWLTFYQGVPKGWWYVLKDGQLTYWMPPHGGDDVYIYDGTRWRRQAYEHFQEWGPDPTKAEGYVNRFDLVSEEYLPEGKDPPL